MAGNEQKSFKDQDPDGLGANEAGAKLDFGKPRIGLVLGSFCRALWKVAEVGTFGANKYTDNGWLEVENGQARYEDAQLRHWLKKSMGEELDPESGLDHLAHEAWNALAKLELKLREQESKSSESIIQGLMVEALRYKGDSNGSQEKD